MASSPLPVLRVCMLKLLLVVRKYHEYKSYLTKFNIRKHLFLLRLQRTNFSSQLPPSAPFLGGGSACLPCHPVVDSFPALLPIGNRFAIYAQSFVFFFFYFLGHLGRGNPQSSCP